MKRYSLIFMAIGVVFSLMVWSTSWASPGDLKWKYSSSGGHGEAIVLDSKGNRILVTKSYDSATGSHFCHVISVDKDGYFNWQKSYSEGHGYYEAYAVAIDSKDNTIVVGHEDNGSDKDWKVISYSPSGAINWQRSYDGGHGSDYAKAVAIDSKDNAIVVGCESNGSDKDWKIISYSPSGTIEWQASYDSKTSNYDVSAFGNGKDGRVPAVSSPNDDKAEHISIDRSSGEIVVAGEVLDGTNALIIDCEGYPPAASGHILVPSDVRTVQPAAETPNANSTNGTYLGFGDVVANGTHFKVEAAFPTYLKESDNSTLAVKIFIAAQLPDDYSRLAFFDSSNNLKFQPPDTLSSWKSSVSGEVEKTSIFPETAVGTDSSIVPSGTHYWYTLVVPDTVPDDFAGVDWSTTPWEITVNVFEVK